MLVVRYFLFMGGVLAGLLILSDRYLPKPAAALNVPGIDRSIIRIHSRQRWPAAVTIDTSVPMPTVTPAPVIANADTAAPATAAREANALAPSSPRGAEKLAEKAPDRPQRHTRHAARLSWRSSRQHLAYQPTEPRGWPLNGW